MPRYAQRLAGEATGPTDPKATCESLTVEGCGGRSDCAAIEAAPAEQDGGCMGVARAVGCMDGQSACGDAITYGVDPSGNGWWFMDTCIPSGWTSAPYPNGETPPPCQK